MRTLFVCTMLLILSATSFGQQTNPSQTLTSEDYLKKSKNQKTAGWILLGGGALMTTIGAVVVMNDLEDIYVNIFDPNPPPVNDDDGTLGSVLFIGGVLAMAGSILLFIAASKNRRKAAASVSFKMENATMISQWAVSNKQYPAVVVKFRL